MEGAWFEDEDFWVRFAPLMFDGPRWAEVPGAVDGLLRLARAPSPPPAPDLPAPAVLDACCGPGRHSVELARRGYAVTGIDITDPYLEAARESAAAEGVAVEFLHADLREFVRPGAFDLAVNLFRSFGYFEREAEDRKALENIRKSLKPGGAFVIETLGKEVAVHDFIEDEWYERDGWTVLNEYRVEGDWDGLRHRWILERDGGRFERSFVLRLYSASELRRLLLGAGFSSVSIHGNLQGIPYDHKATDLVAVASV